MFDLSYDKLQKKWDGHPVMLWENVWYANTKKNIRTQTQAQPFWERLVPHRKSTGMIGNLVEQEVKTMNAMGNRHNGYDK